jgi:hypothetical protein
LALMIREGEGLTYDQIAERTGVTSGTVESLLWRARQSLKREFTVLAGGEGALAFIPFLVALGARVRASGRRAVARLTHVAGFGDQPGAHAAVAAIAALTVATGVIATLGIGGSRAAAPTVLVNGARPATHLAAPVQAAPITPVAAPPATAPSTGPSGTTAAPSTTTPVRRGPTGTGTAPLRLRNPIAATGRKAVNEAGGAPLNVNIPNAVVVGVSPTQVVDYTNNLLKHL